MKTSFVGDRNISQCLNRSVESIINIDENDLKDKRRWF